jgi:hypothetical protein
MRRDDIRGLVKTQGVRSVVESINNLLEGRTLENGVKIKLRPDQFSIRELWEGFVGDVEETLPSAGGESLIQEEVNSTGFVATSRLLIAATVIAAYNSVPTIGDQLVTDMPSKKRFETIAGFTESEGLKDVNESMPYEDSGLGEKYVTSQVGKRGRLIYVTEEAIMEDQTGQLLMRAQRIGKMAAIDKEKTIINGVLDKFGTVYKPSGTATGLYSTTHGNLMGTAGAVTGFTTAVPLVDWSDIDEVEQFYPLSIKDDRAIGDQDPIIWSPDTLLVPNAKKATGLRIRNATEIRIKTDSGNTNTVFTNPKAGMFNVLSSPFIASSGVAGAAADWYYGNFKDQFYWHNVWPVQTFAQGANSQNAWERDVVAGYKVRYLGGVMAMDFRHVVKVKAA